MSYGLINQELERGDSGVRAFSSVQGALVMYPIYAFGSEEQKKEWLPALASAEKIGCFGLTEPDYGSNPGGMITTAKKVDDGWVLNGTKMWITNGPVSNTFVIYAKTEPDSGSRGITAFLVEKGWEGFEPGKPEDTLGIRS